jgi:hypothetical protein
MLFDALCVWLLLRQFQFQFTQQLLASFASCAWSGDFNAAHEYLWRVWTFQGLMLCMLLVESPALDFRHL